MVHVILKACLSVTIATRECWVAEGGQEDAANKVTYRYTVDACLLLDAQNITVFVVLKHFIFMYLSATP